MTRRKQPPSLAHTSLPARRDRGGKGHGTEVGWQLHGMGSFQVHHQCLSCPAAALRLDSATRPVITMHSSPTGLQHLSLTAPRHQPMATAPDRASTKTYVPAVYRYFCERWDKQSPGPNRTRVSGGGGASSRNGEHPQWTATRASPPSVQLFGAQDPTHARHLPSFGLPRPRGGGVIHRCKDAPTTLP